MRINLKKSELILMGRVDKAEALETELECQISSFSSNYLGLPLGIKYKSMVIWDNIEERMRSR